MRTCNDHGNLRDCQRGSTPTMTATPHCTCENNAYIEQEHGMGHAATTQHCSYAIQFCSRQYTIQQRSLLIGKILRSPSDELCLVWPLSSKAPPAILLQRHSHGSKRSGTCSCEVSRQQPFLESNTSLLALPPIARWWLIYCRRQMDEQLSSFSSNHPAPWGFFFRRGFIRQLSLLSLQ